MLCVLRQCALPIEFYDHCLRNVFCFFFGQAQYDTLFFELQRSRGEVRNYDIFLKRLSAYDEAMAASAPTPTPALPSRKWSIRSVLSATAVCGHIAPRTPSEESQWKSKSCYRRKNVVRRPIGTCGCGFAWCATRVNVNRSRGRATAETVADPSGSTTAAATGGHCCRGGATSVASQWPRPCQRHRAGKCAPPRSVCDCRSVCSCESVRSDECTVDGNNRRVHQREGQRRLGAGALTDPGHKTVATSVRRQTALECRRRRAQREFGGVVARDTEDEVSIFFLCPFLFSDSFSILLANVIYLEMCLRLRNCLMAVKVLSRV